MLLRRNLNRSKYHYLAIRTLLYLSFFKASHAPDCLDQCTNGLQHDSNREDQVMPISGAQNMFSIVNKLTATSLSAPPLTL